VLRFLHGALEVIVAIALFTVGVALVALGSSVIAAPFNDALSEAVESLYMAQAMPRFSTARAVRDLIRTVGLELLKLLIYAAVMLPLLGISLLAPLAPLQAVVGFCFTALFFAIDYVDFAAARRELTPRQRIRWALSHPRAMLGLGMSIWLLLLTPLLNLLFMPAAVAGGTLLFLDLAGPRAGQTEQGGTAGRRTPIPL